MDPKAVTKAQARLRIARQQLHAAEGSEDYNAFKDAWYLFLVAAKNVYTSLEQGAKISPQSRQWFGAKKAQRRSDPLLQYLFQARDDDEHGLAEVTRLTPGGLGIGLKAPGFSNDITIENLTLDARGHFAQGTIRSNDGLPVLISDFPDEVHLMPVTGRGGITFQPPETHLGQPVPDHSPITVGKLGLSYLESLVTEAEAKAA